MSSKDQDIETTQLPIQQAYALSNMYTGTLPKSADWYFCAVCSSAELTLQKPTDGLPVLLFYF